MPNGYPYYQPYYPPPVYYPPPEKRSNLGAMIVVGGLAAVGISAALLYLLSKQNKPECTGDADCQTGYVCENNKCVLAYDCINDTDCPPGYICQNHKCVHEFIPCTDQQCANLTCEPRINGMQRCDSRHNLCRCDGNAWFVKEENSDACAACPPCTSPRYNDCFVDENGQALCYWNMGYGDDVCPTVGESYKCPCSQTVGCNVATSMCCSDSICRIKGSQCGQFMVNRSSPGVTAWEENGAQYFMYEFSPTGIPNFKTPIGAAGMLNAIIQFEWGPWPGEYVHGMCWVRYNGTWTSVWDDQWIWVWGSTGNIKPGGGAITFPLPQCFDAIEIGLNARWSNIRPTTVSCTFD